MTKQAKLPARLTTRLVKHVLPGEVCWTVPWAMQADSDGLLWLDTGYNASGYPAGTVQMRVELHEDGYHVWPVPGEKYTPSGKHDTLTPVAVLEAERQ